MNTCLPALVMIKQKTQLREQIKDEVLPDFAPNVFRQVTKTEPRLPCQVWVSETTEI